MCPNTRAWGIHVQCRFDAYRSTCRSDCPMSTRVEGNMTSAETRHKARTTALKVLFEADLTPHDVNDVLERYLELSGSPYEVQSYLRTLVEGVRDNMEEIDAEIARAAPQFPVDQLAAIDRNVLRIAVYELRHQTGVPVKAAI